MRSAGRPAEELRDGGLSFELLLFEMGLDGGLLFSFVADDEPLEAGLAAFEEILGTGGLVWIALLL